MKGKLKVNPVIRRWILISGPFIFSLFSAFVYILIYSPVRDTPDHSNITMVFAAALGWGAQILHGNREMYRVSYVFTGFSIGIPILIFEVFRLYPYDLYQGRIIIGMIIAGNLWLLLIFRNLRTSVRKTAKEG